MCELQGRLQLGDQLSEGSASELITSAYALEAGDGPLFYPTMSLADLAGFIMLLRVPTPTRSTGLWGRRCGWLPQQAHLSRLNC
jgi:hypothetical protein